MLNQIEEIKFTELKDKCRELKVAIFPEVFITTQVHDKNGVLVWDNSERAHSWIRNFYNTLIAYLFGYTGGGGTYNAGYLSLKIFNGTVVACSYCTPATLGAVNDATKGIIVGTGDAAAAINDYTLTLIANGTGSGQFSHQAEAQPVPSYDSGNKVWSMVRTRIFNNNSGGSITVKETGLLGYTTTQVLMERSVLASPVVVANGAQLTVTYTITMDFSTLD